MLAVDQFLPPIRMAWTNCGMGASGLTRSNSSGLVTRGSGTPSSPPSGYGGWMGMGVGVGVGVAVGVRVGAGVALGRRLGGLLFTNPSFSPL